MQTQPNVGDRVRVHPSGETGQIAQVMRRADGGIAYEVRFDRAASEQTAAGSGETGGLYSVDDIERLG